MFSPDGTLISASAAPHCGLQSTKSVDNSLGDETRLAIYSSSVTESKTLAITVIIEGNQILAVADTAAQVSVIHTKTANRWAIRKNSKSTVLRGIGNQLVPAEVIADAQNDNKGTSCTRLPRWLRRSMKTCC